ncbi:EAL domain-containing protein [Paracoccus luteus]|uniref:EAL domain-containing protein n=1 Tax=Paracoccus luteus TaxID=2508543 RepID=UPI00106F299E|nr:EAL domain-containing protein [Paracoccus luteus]
MGGILGRLTAWAPRPRHADRDCLALVLRIDNMAALSRCLGAAVVAGLLGQVASRLASGLRLGGAIQMDQGGHLCALLSARQSRGSARVALRVQALSHAGFDLPLFPVSPQISAVLVRGPAHVGPTALFDAGRRHLARHAAPAGAGVPVVDWIAAAGRPVPPRAARRAPIDPAQAEVRFQPQLCCHTGAVTGFAAVPRLRHPPRGLLDPADVRPTLSPSDRLALNAAVLTQGLAALRHWDRAGHAVGTVSLGLSPADLCQPRLAEMLLWELDRQDIAPARLVIEVREAPPRSDGSDHASANLHRLTEAGCRIDLDGFGTGHASLESIRRLRVRRVKIDRSFLQGCDRDPAQQRMILAMLALADHLGLETLADGVDSGAERAFAAQIGCSQVQGLAVSAPLPLDRTDAFLIRCREQADDMPRLRRRA